MAQARDALGADAVAIGKLWAWGQGAAGTAGVTRVLEILENEIVSAMGLMGITCIDQLGPEYLTRADPPSPGTDARLHVTVTARCIAAAVFGAMEVWMLDEGRSLPELARILESEPVPSRESCMSKIRSQPPAR